MTHCILCIHVVFVYIHIPQKEFYLRLHFQTARSQLTVRGVGTGPAGPAAAGPIFRQKEKVRSTERGLCRRLLVLTQSQT